MQSIFLIDVLLMDQQKGEKKFHHKSLESGADMVNNINTKRSIAESPSTIFVAKRTATMWIALCRMRRYSITQRTRNYNRAPS